MIQQIENRIIERLCSIEMFVGMDIEPFPANFEDYNFTSSLGCLLVRYSGEDFSEPQTLGATVQSDTYSYTIYCGLRSLSRLTDGYPVLNEIKDVLTGFRVNGKELYPVSIRYAGKINYNDNFWSLVFKTKQSNASKYEYSVIPPIWDSKRLKVNK